MLNWLKNIFGGSGEQKQNPSREPESGKPEFRPAKLPPRRDETSQTGKSEIIETAFELQWFELQVSPHEFRFALARGSDGLIAYKRNKNSKCENFLLQYKQQGNIEPAFVCLQFLLHKHKVIETPVHMPEKVFQPDTLSIPSMHLRFRYVKRNWQSWYLMNEIPSNIQAFFDDCHQHAVSVTTRSPKSQLSREEILKNTKEGLEKYKSKMTDDMQKRIQATIDQAEKPKRDTEC
jgi:hypothetical protein